MNTIFKCVEPTTRDMINPIVKEFLCEIRDISKPMAGILYEYLARMSICEINGDVFTDSCIDVACDILIVGETFINREDIDEVLEEENRHYFILCGDKYYIDSNPDCCGFYCLKSGGICVTKECNAIQRGSYNIEYLPHVIIAKNIEWSHEINIHEFTRLISLCRGERYRNVYNQIKEFYQGMKGEVIYSPIAEDPSGFYGIADIVIGDTLYDFKCAVSERIEYKLQILAYASLLNNEKSVRINKVGIINPLTEKITEYDISHFTEEMFRRFVSFLCNGEKI
jgi:hypothetical protein